MSASARTIASALLISSIMVWVAAPVAAADEPDDARVRFLIASLEKPIKQIDKGTIALPVLIDKLCAEASPAGADKDPKKRVVIVVSLVPVEQVALDEKKEPIKVSIYTKLVGVRLDRVLDLICRQLDGVVLVRDDFIEIVSRTSALTEFGLGLTDEEIAKIEVGVGFARLGFNIDNYQPAMPTLVHGFFTKVPLDKALQQIARRYDQNIVLSPQAEAKAAAPVSARLVNVPVESAVEALANSADLRVIRKANVYYVTTKEQAAEIRAEQKKQASKPMQR